jgi:hypothetical protein
MFYLGSPRLHVPWYFRTLMTRQGGYDTLVVWTMECLYLLDTFWIRCTETRSLHMARAEMDMEDSVVSFLSWHIDPCFPVPSTQASPRHPCLCIDSLIPRRI